MLMAVVQFDTRLIYVDKYNDIDQAYTIWMIFIHGCTGIPILLTYPFARVIYNLSS